jgi:hypothetical protein
VIVHGIVLVAVLVIGRHIWHHHYRGRPKP